MNITQEYKNYCEELGINFEEVSTVNSYDDTTLFCPAGMQKYKEQFKDESYEGLVANVQSCLRLSDLYEIGDGSHSLSFDMLGLFSFRYLALSEAISFWLNFITKRLGLKLDYVTIHPDKINDKTWTHQYKQRGIEIRPDVDCTWTDGEIGGYCTEFYVDGIEVGNIVNTLGTCIDVGFGKDRLEDMLVNSTPPKNKTQVLQEGILKIVESGFKPSNTKQGYILRKLLRELYKIGGTLDHGYFSDEVKRQVKIQERYDRLKDKNKDKSPEWWYDTHGIEINLVD